MPQERKQAMLQFNAKSNMKFCAFCKFWYDPTNSAIFPKAPQIGLWEFDNKVENICQKTGTKKKANMPGCSNYTCKLP